MTKQQTLDPPASSAPQRHLTLFDSTSIIVGIIIGAVIYESTPMIAANVPGPGSLIGIWVGGVLSLIGALCYVELATMYPKQGGDYVYLSRAFGRPVGFLFAWSQLWIVRPGSIGAMAYIFARYANRLWPLDGFLTSIEGIDPAQAAMLIYAVAPVLALSLVNILGVRQGKWTQNTLTTAKFLGLALVCVVGLSFSAPAVAAAAPAATAPRNLDFGLAMILVLFAYGGWNEMAYVGAEVRDPKRNILRALLWGTAAVMVLYVLATLAFLHALGFEGVRHAEAMAADVLKLGLGEAGEKFISLLIAVSALGAINGQIFTGARIYYAMGSEHKLYAPLGRWHRKLGTPVWSLVIQAAITLALVVGFGVKEGAFERLIVFTTPVFWIFMVLVGLSLFQLRESEPQTPRPYRVFGYPFTPFIFCVSSVYMVYRGLLWAYLNSSYEAFWAVGFLALGGLLCLYDPLPSQPLEAPPADE